MSKLVILLLMVLLGEANSSAIFDLLFTGKVASNEQKICDCKSEIDNAVASATSDCNLAPETILSKKLDSIKSDTTRIAELERRLQFLQSTINEQNVILHVFMEKNFSQVFSHQIAADSKFEEAITSFSKHLSESTEMQQKLEGSQSDLNQCQSKLYQKAEELAACRVPADLAWRLFTGTGSLHVIILLLQPVLGHCQDPKNRWCTLSPIWLGIPAALACFLVIMTRDNWLSIAPVWYELCIYVSAFSGCRFIWQLAQTLWISKCKSSVSEETHCTDRLSSSESNAALEARYEKEYEKSLETLRRRETIPPPAQVTSDESESESSSGSIPFRDYTSS